MDRKSAEAMMRKDPEAFLRKFLSLDSALESMTERRAKDSQVMAMQKMRIDNLSSRLSKQSSTIQEQSSTIQEQISRISDQSTIIEAQSQTIQEQRREVEELKARIAELEEIGRMACAERYKPSTESLDSIFPEFEALFDELDREAKDEGKEAREKAPGKKKDRKPRKARKP